MAYVKTNWVDDVTPLSSSNMNNIENGLVEHIEDYTAHWKVVADITLAQNTALVEIVLPSEFLDFVITGIDMQSPIAQTDTLRLKYNTSTTYYAIAYGKFGAGISGAVGIMLSTDRKRITQYGIVAEIVQTHMIVETSPVNSVILEGNNYDFGAGTRFIVRGR